MVLITWSCGRLLFSLFHHKLTFLYKIAAEDNSPFLSQPHSYKPVLPRVSTKNRNPIHSLCICCKSEDEKQVRSIIDARFQSLSDSNFSLLARNVIAELDLLCFKAYQREIDRSSYAPVVGNTPLTMTTMRILHAQLSLALIERLIRLAYPNSFIGAKSS